MVKEWNLTDMVVDGVLGSGRAFSRDELTDTDVARFEARVDRSAGPDACHPWTGARTKKGHGQVGVCRGRAQTHRVAYVVSHGFIPAGLVVRHRCDNPPCCNPAHLQLGTVRDNVRDAVERGQHATGERHGSAKLTEADVNDMRRRARQGVTGRELAREYGVARSVVHDAVTGRRWKSASEPPVKPRRACPRRWTPAEDAVVFEGSPAEVAERLGRSYDSVTTRRHALRARQGVAA